jgi:hypothetical protein
MAVGRVGAQQYRQRILIFSVAVQAMAETHVARVRPMAH